MGRHAIINEKNIVVNVIEWDGEPWNPPLGHALIASNVLNVGDIYVKPTNDATPHAIPAKPDTNAWQRFTGSFRRGGK